MEEGGTSTIRASEGDTANADPPEADPREAGSSSITSQNNQILECPVCYNLYDHETRLPKVLRCGHTVCLECLHQIRATRQHILRCPSCRKDHAFDGQVEVLPNNFTALQVLDALCIKCTRQIFVDEQLKMCQACLRNYIKTTTRELNRSVQQFDSDIVILSSDIDSDRQAELILRKRNSLEKEYKDLFMAYRELLSTREGEILDEIQTNSESDLDKIRNKQQTLHLEIATVTTKLDELKHGLSNAGSITNGRQTKHLQSLTDEIKDLLGKAKTWPKSTIRDSNIHLCKSFVHTIDKCMNSTGSCDLCCARHMLNSLNKISNASEHFFNEWYGNASVSQVFHNENIEQEVFHKPIDAAVSPVDGTLIVLNDSSNKLVFFGQVDYTGGEYRTRHQYEFKQIVDDLGEEGSQFSSIDFDKNGNFYLMDTRHHCIWVHNSNRERINRFGTTGQFKDPTGIAVHPDTGNMYVVDEDNYKIQVLASDGRFVEQFMFPARAGNHRMIRIAPQSVVVKHNKIYVLGDDSRIYIHDMNWNQLDIQETYDHIDANLAVDEYGNILASMIYPQVYFQNPKSNVALVLGGNENDDEWYQFKSVSSIAVNKDGDLIVCDYVSNNIKVLSCLYS